MDDEELSGPAPQPYRAFEDENESNAVDHSLATNLWMIAVLSCSPPPLRMSTNDTLDKLMWMPTIHNFQVWRVGCKVIYIYWKFMQALWGGCDIRFQSAILTN